MKPMHHFVWLLVPAVVAGCKKDGSKADKVDKPSVNFTVAGKSYPVDDAVAGFRSHLGDWTLDLLVASGTGGCEVYCDKSGEARPYLIDFPKSSCAKSGGTLAYAEVTTAKGVKLQPGKVKYIPEMLRAAAPTSEAFQARPVSWGTYGASGAKVEPTKEGSDMIEIISIDDKQLVFKFVAGGMTSDPIGATLCPRTEPPPPLAATVTTVPPAPPFDAAALAAHQPKIPEGLDPKVHAWSSETLDGKDKSVTWKLYHVGKKGTINAAMKPMTTVMIRPLDPPYSFPAPTESMNTTCAGFPCGDGPGVRSIALPHLHLWIGRGSESYNMYPVDAQGWDKLYAALDIAALAKK